MNQNVLSVLLCSLVACQSAPATESPEVPPAVVAQASPALQPPRAAQDAQDTLLNARVAKDYQGLYRIGTVRDIPTQGMEPAELVQRWGADWRSRNPLIWNGDFDADGKPDKLVLLVQTPAGMAKSEKAEAELEDGEEMGDERVMLAVYFADGKKETIGLELGEETALSSGVRVSPPGTKITQNGETETLKGSAIYKGERVYHWEDGHFGIRSIYPDES